MQLVQVGFSISSALVIIRFLDNISIAPSFGLLIEMLQSMIGSSFPILFIMFWSALAFGTAFAGLIPVAQSNADAYSRPLWYGIRTVVGDFDLTGFYEYLGDAYTPDQNIMGHACFWFMWLYAFLVTIYIVNLLIAQMTTNYENIRAKT